jgi:hypothetical protein
MPEEGYHEPAYNPHPDDHWTILLGSCFARKWQLGTAQETRAMLDKAVVAVKADQAVALGMFNKGEGGF